LNLQEKRRIEKLVFDEIDQAVRKLTSNRSDSEDELKERLKKNPPAAVKKLREEVISLEKQLEEKNTTLHKEGFELNYENNLTIRHYGEYVNKDILDFREESEKRRRALEDMRKEFIVKIYADSDEVKDIFGVVSERIQKVIV
jgi:hypothetical protein